MNRSSKQYLPPTRINLAATNSLVLLTSLRTLAVTALLFASLMVGSCDFLGQSSGNNNNNGKNDLSYTTLTIGQAKDATLAAGFTFNRFQFTIGAGAAGTYTIALMNVAPTNLGLESALFKIQAAADLVANAPDAASARNALSVAQNNGTVFKSPAPPTAATTYFLLVSGGTVSESGVSRPGAS